MRTLGELVKVLGGKLVHGSPQWLLDGVNSAESAGPSDVVFAEDAAGAAKAFASNAGVVELRAGNPELYEKANCVVEAEQPRMWFALAAKLLNPLPPASREPGSVGGATGIEIGIMDETGNLLPVGTPGEVVIRGDSVVAGYENNPEANISSFTNGWFRTGDQGVLDGEGYLTLTGRLKEMINRGGVET